MSQPLAQFHILRTGAEGQEVTPHIERGVLLLKEVFGGVGVICGEIVDGQTVGQRGRIRHGAGSGILRSLCGTLRGVVLVVSSPAKSLAAIQASQHKLKT